ncbi:MAG: acyl-CoA/acyl-ACP dehydrogenase [Planctomycetaceae bacterium]|nr:acyl-CoA/acyl-ACP dehydrogenase [Planctomycetaceae bacterium]
MTTVKDSDSSVIDTENAPRIPTEATTFAAEALKMGGKSEDEVRRMGAVDAADDRVEQMFEKRYQTVNSPAHRAVWESVAPIELFGFDKPAATASEAATQVMEASLNVVRKHLDAGTLMDEEKKISKQVLNDLGEVGYWGLLISPHFGGSGASFLQFATFLTKMATLDPTIAGLASVHGCIGAVDPLITFGNDDQKSRLLPLLASGKRLSAFALTEPGAGSDLTALKTTAVLDGDDYVLNGEKLFITNVQPGRMIGVVCLIDNKPAVLIAELPEEENENFSLRRYGLWALKHTHNCGILFNNFRVPVANRLDPGDGDGLTIAYHGLNRGRVALCANAAGTMRGMLTDMIPWAKFRVTYGEPIGKRELVQRRLGEIAGLIVACDALTNWTGNLLDLGYRGEMECVVAKIFGSEAQKHAAIELHMKTHGGRSFLHGHIFGDNVHEFLAPCIYEGEGEMLGLAFFKSLVKQHGRQFFEPIGKALQKAGIKNPNPANPAHAWALKGPLWEYSKWFTRSKLQRRPTPQFPRMDASLRKHAEFAVDFLHYAAFETSGAMRTHQLKLADRQCRMAEISARIQRGIVILSTSLYAGQHENELVRTAGDVICTQLTDQLLGRRPTDAFLKKVTRLGEKLTAQKFPGTEHIEPPPILMTYSNDK